MNTVFAANLVDSILKRQPLEQNTGGIPPIMQQPPADVPPLPPIGAGQMPAAPTTFRGDVPAVDPGANFGAAPPPPPPNFNQGPPPPVSETAANFGAPPAAPTTFRDQSYEEPVEEDVTSGYTGPPAIGRPRTFVDDALAPKDFSRGIYEDAEGNITHDPKKSVREIKARGADRDEKWSLWDKIKSGIVGWAQGGIGGAIKAATDRNYFEKMEDENTRARLLPQIAQNQAIAARDVQTENARLAPTLKREQIQAGLTKQVQAQKDRLAVLREKEQIEGKQWTQVSRNGKLYKHFTKGGGPDEPLIDPTTGKQERDLLNEPVEVTDENGRKTYVKGGQLMTAQATKDYRDAVLGQGQQRIDQAGQRLALDEAKFNQTKSEFERVQGLREQVVARQNETEMRNYDLQLDKMMQWAAENLKARKIDQGQHDILMQTIQNKRIRPK